MSTELVISEIKRFLASNEPEVLCIRGRWGVGKTFAWRRYLADASQSGKLRSQDYAYVSLFGLNSLDELRYAIFESTVPPDKVLTGPNPETFGTLFDKGVTIGRKTRSWLGPALSAFGLGEIGNALSRSAFLLVRNQLVCLDDLERSGEGLKARDVLGMVSFLKEQRNCRVVLLLNEEAMHEDDQEEFGRLLEKVIDTFLTFSPTPTEAGNIAISDDSDVGKRLRNCIDILGITNIRVIKKIERLALRLANTLKDYRPEIVNQAVVACALGGWAVFEPDRAPSLNFIRNYNSIVIAMRERNEGDDEQVNRWRDTFSALPYSYADEIDRVIFDGISVGYFSDKKLLSAARDLDKAFARHNRESSFARAWDRYHGNLFEEDDQILDAIRDGALENLTEIDAVNLNAALHLLRECGRVQDAYSLANSYVGAMPNEASYFDLRSYHFMPDQPIDPALQAAILARQEKFEDKRDPLEALIGIAKAQNWNDQDERLLSALSADDFQEIFENPQTPDLRSIVKVALLISAQGGPIAQGSIRPSVHEALTRIAQKSLLRARRLRNWGFAVQVRENG